MFQPIVIVVIIHGLWFDWREVPNCSTTLFSSCVRCWVEMLGLEKTWFDSSFLLNIDV